MKKNIFLTIVIISLVLYSVLTSAHLCNDVFIQAKDNLAVKVDIRDDQLRINTSAKFRVYLLNTMDRDIVDIRLGIITDDFDTVVTPSPGWRSFPYLKTINRNGQKEYFEVELKRKEGTTQGKYKIGLHLYNGQDESMVFKTVDITDAMVTKSIPQRAAQLKIDGKVNSEEWKQALLCTSLYEYKKTGKYFENFSSMIRTRFRFAHDDEFLYCLIDFQDKSKKDIANIYISNDYETKPATISVQLQSRDVKINGEVSNDVITIFNGTKAEVAIPFKLLDVKGRESFYTNLVRIQDATWTYWRGNKSSFMDPVVFANFILE
ncbi:MAG: hypothetical protein ACMUIU_09005 [bacterium]